MTEYKQIGKKAGTGLGCLIKMNHRESDSRSYFLLISPGANENISFLIKNQLNISMRDTMKTLREMMDIIENLNTGWQDSEDTVIPDGLGLIQIGDRIDDNGEIVETMMNYFNPKVSNYDNGLVFGIRIKNKEIYEFDYQMNPSGKLVGDFKNRAAVKELFATRVGEYLSSFTRKIMENKMIFEVSEDTKRKLESGGLFALCPGLESKIDSALEKHWNSIKLKEESLEKEQEDPIKKIDELFKDR